MPNLPPIEFTLDQMYPDGGRYGLSICNNADCTNFGEPFEANADRTACYAQSHPHFTPHGAALAELHGPGAHRLGQEAQAGDASLRLPERPPRMGRPAHDPVQGAAPRRRPSPDQGQHGQPDPAHRSARVPPGHPQALQGEDSSKITISVLHRRQKETTANLASPTRSSTAPASLTSSGPPLRTRPTRRSASAASTTGSPASSRCGSPTGGRCSGAGARRWNGAARRSSAGRVKTTSCSS